MSRPVDHIVDVALETYQLAMSMDPVNEKALRAAIEAAVVANEKDIMHDVLQHLDAHASWGISDIEEQPVIYQAMEYLTQAMDAQKVPAPPYKPRQGDVVRIVLEGEVRVLENACPNCGHTEGGEFSVNHRGMEYFFDPAEVVACALDIRVVKRTI